MKSFAAIIFVSLLLAGCVTTQPLSYGNLHSAESFITMSNTLVRQQHWGKAQLLLEEGMLRFPDNQPIKDALSKVQIEWQFIKDNLNDWMLVYEVEGMLLTRPLLVSMTKSDPEDYQLKRRLQVLDSSLNAKRETLITCTQHEFKKSLKLARRCVEAAEKIHLSTQVQKLLSQIESEQSNIIKKAQKEVALSKAEARNAVLMQARSYLQERFYYAAVKVLEPLVLQDDQDQQVNILMEEAQTGRDLQVLQLISHGDRLYREERIQEALEIWQQAAVLDPTHEDVTLRISRATKVLDKLKEILSKE